MGFFGLLFWVVAIVLLTRACRARRWGHRYERRAFRRSDWGQGDDQGSVIDALETRIHELEERLDFTERLLESRSTPATRA